MKTDAPIMMGCASDGGVDVWVADRDGARIIGRNETPIAIDQYGARPFLAQLNPYRLLYATVTDAGTAFVTTCTSGECHELFEVFSVPPNAGVDDAGALFIADYILDAGLRVTRFAPGAW